MLSIAEAARDALRSEAEAARPAECCGVLAGRGGRIVAVLPVPNAADDALARFEMDPAELWAARRRANGLGLEVIGYYHSHPTTAAVPSARDVDRAYYPEAVYAIVSIEPSFEVRVFRISDGVAEELLLGVD